MTTSLKDKILVVDDEELNILLLGKILNKNGYQVAAAYDGQQALDMMAEAEEGPVAILMDLMMPNVSGWEAARALKHRKETSQIPIIATTSLSVGETLSVEDGFDGYCIKPISEKKLMNVINACIKAKHS